MKIVEKDITKLIPAEYNPRQLTKDQHTHLRASLERFGAVDPAIINRHKDRKNIIIGGHQRIKIAKELGWETFPCVEVELSRDKERELNIRLNKNTGGWDWDELANYFDVNDLTDWGFSDEDLFGDGMFGEAESGEDEYEVPDESDIETDIQLGDLIEIGRHRLLCGDSTDADMVKKLMGGGRPMLMVTDPPYGVNYDPEWREEAKMGGISQRGTVKNDDRADWSDVVSLFEGNIIYMWHADKFTHVVAAFLEDCGFEIICQIIWNKNTGAISRGDYHWKHEPCWYAVRKGKKHNWQGARDQWSVWDIQNLTARNVLEREGQTGHPTQKPIECMARPIKNNSEKGDSVYDPFLGSGSAMVAAHQLGRTCYGMELDERYCQVIIDRMISLDSTLKISINGESYE